jgi:predicted CXXCH cytochrome family protein
MHDPRNLPSDIRAAAAILAILAGTLAAGCVESAKTVFQQQDLTAGVPAAAGGFIGYSDTASQLTVCGNCHVDRQAHWIETGHAHAWLTLEQNGGLQPICEACHSVNGRGNETPDTANVGFLATNAVRYHDVQCENCHGPGLAHVQNPTFQTAPLAPVAVGVNLDRGCGQCHNGTHHPFVEEWAQSPHSQVLAAPAGNVSCQGCHIAQGALQQFNVEGRYIEQDSAALPITCVVCHDPHGTQNGHELRFAINTPDPTKNLCMRCHNRRAGPDPSEPTRGPHAPQTALLLGTAGWWAPNLTIQPGEIVATHGSSANPNMCATCHVQSFAVTDSSSGNLIFQATGHLFIAIPCLTEQGIPTTDTTCTLQQRTFQACTASGCHGTQDAARSAFTVATNRIQALNDELKALLARVPASAFNANDSIFSTAEGAKFNSQLADMAGSVVHNPFLLESLLTASITQVEKDYSLAPASNLVLKNIMRTFPH